MLLKAILCVVCMHVHICVRCMCVCDACMCLQRECPDTCVQSRRQALVASSITLRLTQDLSLNLEFMQHLTGRQRAPVILLSLPSSGLGFQIIFSFYLGAGTQTPNFICAQQIFLRVPPSLQP